MLKYPSAKHAKTRLTPKEESSFQQTRRKIINVVENNENAAFLELRPVH